MICVNETVLYEALPDDLRVERLWEYLRQRNDVVDDGLAIESVSESIYHFVGKLTTLSQNLAGATFLIHHPLGIAT